MKRFSKSVWLRATILSSLAGAASAASLPPAAPLVKGPVDDSVITSLTGDLPHALATARDQGKLDDRTALPHIRLELKRPADRQAALDKLAHDQQVRGSAVYRKWLTPAELRAYGPAQADIDKVTAWLVSHGLTVHGISPSGMSIVFGGSAKQVATAFHTELHTVMHGLEAHIANVSAPAIPSALAPVVTGVTLANFFPKPQFAKVTPAITQGTSNGTFYAVGPADFDTIYNINPLLGSNNFYGAPITGAGVTVAVVEQTIIKTKDWNRFRQEFGLTGYAGTLTQTHPGGCTAPGFTGDEVEAALDAEWASAPAPDAAIIEASCATVAPLDFGVETALTNLVEGGTTATIFSISYGGDEAANGLSFEQGWVNLLEEGAAEGISIFVSSGDSGSSADEGSIDVDGLFVNGLADSAYNVSVGGTDFYDTALGQDTKYWRPTDKAYGSSAISYVPEIPWNNGCSSSILWKFVGATDAISLCNDTTFTGGQNNIGGSGSQSVYYPKPDWQLTSVPGMPNDGVRDQPDVSLFAANGLWGHFYVYCMSDAKEGGAPCVYTGNNIFNNAAGGTSFASPAFAGVTALIQQTIGSALGNVGPELYTLAQAQYTNPYLLTNCNATLGNKISSACVFNDIRNGDIVEPCYKGSPNCSISKESTNGIGILAIKPGSGEGLAYLAGPGYSVATGLGTVNVTNLLYNYY
jgi:subtilase family serine protease